MKIFSLPIEPLPERYSIQWRQWFDRAFRVAVVNNTWIDGKMLTSKIEVGSFLDVYGTNFYKMHQIANVVKMVREKKIKNGDWVFLHDLWTPGLQSLAYVRDGAGVGFKIAGCLHAGTWDGHDFLNKKGMAIWARSFEESFLLHTDLIFVATEFHKKLILKTHGTIPGLESKIRITGFPIFPQTLSKKIHRRSDVIVFPHRLDPEKQPELFEDLRRVFPNLRTVYSKHQTSTKSQYYKLLQESTFAVSFALQETWGIAMQEALFAGAIPLVPDRLSYQEMYLGDLRYSSFKDLVCTIREATTDNDVLRYLKVQAQTTACRLASLGAKAVYNMIGEMQDAN